MLLNGPRSHTFSNAPFTSSRLVLYVTEGGLAPILDLAKEIEEEFVLDATSTRAAPGLLRSDEIRSGGRSYLTPIWATKCGSYLPGVHAI
jgi:hypothetical protein